MMDERMTESERATLCRRIDELCAEVEALKRDEWAAGFSAGCDAVEAAYEDGRPYYEVENAKLQDENARLRSCLSDDAENARMIMDENSTLREAVATAIKVQAVLCGDADSLYCHNECPLHRQESDDCLACDVIGVAQELGIEVN